MRYIVVPKDRKPFTTHWFSIENTYNDGDIVFDSYSNQIYDGNEWEDIEEDDL